MVGMNASNSFSRGYRLFRKASAQERAVIADEGVGIPGI